jgi:hypothetical protein
MAGEEEYAAAAAKMTNAELYGWFMDHESPFLSIEYHAMRAELEKRLARIGFLPEQV